jgi:hypothetical protein
MSPNTQNKVFEIFRSPTPENECFDDLTPPNSSILSQGSDLDLRTKQDSEILAIKSPEKDEDSMEQKLELHSSENGDE